jgi:hypothetical protein
MSPSFCCFQGSAQESLLATSWVLDSMPQVVFDLRAGGLFKVDAPNSDRAQVATLETVWKNS